METTSPTLPFELQDKILKLEEAVKARLPEMPTMLAQIWAALKQQPENVTLLEENQIAIIVSGLEVQTQTTLIQTLSKSGSKAKLKNLSPDDI